MFKLLFYKISINIAKSAAFSIKLLNIGSATNLPGKIARKIFPKVLYCLAKQTKNEIITITGTNGKTTTSGLVASIFQKNGRKIVHNQKGANMLPGITTAVIEKSLKNGVLDVDNCIFEADEAYLSPAFDEFSPDIVLVTNLFRDQLDRYGELNTTAKKIESAVEKASNEKHLKLLLNSDDPLVSEITSNCSNNKINKVYYGFEELKFINSDELTNINLNTPQESVNCKCGNSIEYAKIFYGHLGHYECKCGQKRIMPKITARAEIDINHSYVFIKTPEIQEFKIKINLPGLYNCYNALAAAAVALESNISPDIIIEGIENYSTIFGRSEILKLKEKDVIIQLIKNPVGASEVLRTIQNDKNGKLLIIINDNYADGRDVSWLWDADFELLADYKKTAVVSGIRAADMALRLKYAGIDQNNLIINESIKSALTQALNNINTDEKLYILPTYTALLELEKIKQNFIK
ncbi:MAG: MurT ligase domain-containing protein [Bacillota bacterium]